MRFRFKFDSSRKGAKSAKDRGGHNVIYVHLLFRKHIDPKGYTLFDKDSKGYLNYGDTQSERLRKEVLLDTIWKAREIGNELFNVGMFGARNMFELDREAIWAFQRVRGGLFTLFCISAFQCALFFHLTIGRG